LYLKHQGALEGPSLLGFVNRRYEVRLHVYGALGSRFKGKRRQDSLERSDRTRRAKWISRRVAQIKLKASPEHALQHALRAGDNGIYGVLARWTVNRLLTGKRASAWCFHPCIQCLKEISFPLTVPVYSIALTRGP